MQIPETFSGPTQAQAPVDLRAWTLWQPWASAIIPGPKGIENRPRRLMRIPEGGIWIAVHAGITMDWGAVPWVRERWPEMPDPKMLPLGAILGLMHVVRWASVVDGQQVLPWRPLGCMDDDAWATGPECAVIDDKRALPEPILCRGMMGAWRVPNLAISPLLALL